MDEIPDDLIDVQPEFAAALGLSADAIRAMDLRELVNRATDLGYTLAVSSKPAAAGQGHLTLSCEGDAIPA